MSSPLIPAQTPELVEAVLGVDTHRDVHTAAVITTLGTLRGCQEFPATADGYRELLNWARSQGDVRRSGVECTGSYGASLSRFLQSEQVEVFDVNQPDKRARRSRGKTDAVDAEAAARAVLSGRATAVAKTAQGPVEALRVLKMVRDSAVHARTKAVNQLKAILVTADPELRESLSGLGSKTLIRRCAQLAESNDQQSAAHAATIYALRSLADRILTLTRDADDLEKGIRALVEDAVPVLLERRGVGPDSAAALLIVAGDNADRIRSEGSFAALCGVSPVEASSGNTQRRRLNRGGDRQANAALYRIVISRLRWDQRTQNYMQRRLAEGRSRREVIRCLKRYVAREIFNLITTPTTPSTAHLTEPLAA